ncbi:hypothetical protein ACFQ4K_34250, partial [Tistrella bauzanensis]
MAGPAPVTAPWPHPWRRRVRAGSPGGQAAALHQPDRGHDGENDDQGDTHRTGGSVIGALGGIEDGDRRQIDVRPLQK